MDHRDPKAVYARLKAEAVEEDRIYAEARARIHCNLRRLPFKNRSMLLTLLKREWR